jgi:FAD/FMN-containing dehydrogenase
MENLKLQGRVLSKNDVGFEAAILATLFNKRDYQRRPAMMVEPANVDDIIKTVKHAQHIGKKLSICSGGHSWSANHLRNDSILINMKSFNRFTVNKEALSAIAEPGVGGSTLLTELFNQDLFFPAGHCKGVCIGGYLLQGGFAWNGRKLGMACESVMGLDIVTASGDYVYASPTQNADLYWAARGSGGGFFGVVVRFHLKLYPRPKYYGMTTHVFNAAHLESVFNWAYEVGPSIPPAVEFPPTPKTNLNTPPSS